MVLNLPSPLPRTSDQLQCLLCPLPMFHIRLHPLSWHLLLIRLLLVIQVCVCVHVCSCMWPSLSLPLSVTLSGSMQAQPHPPTPQQAQQRHDSTSTVQADTPQFCSPPSVTGNPNGTPGQVTVHPNPAALPQQQVSVCVCVVTLYFV